MTETILQVPYGTRDVLPGEAAARRQMEDKICSLFALWGYDEVATPTFEYLDTFAGMGQPGAGAFKFFDRKDNILMPPGRLPMRKSLRWPCRPSWKRA